MTHDSDDRLPPDVAAMLSEMPRDAVPPGGLEDRTVAALRARGLLGRPARRGPRAALAVAAAAAAAGLVFFAGYVVGARRGSAPRSAGAGAPHELGAPAGAAGAPSVRAGDGATVVVWF